MSDPLERVPGLGGYLSMRRQNQEQEANTLGQASQMMSLRSAFQQQDEMSKARDIVNSGAPPDEVVRALTAIGPTGAALAQHYAAAAKSAADLKLMNSVDPGAMSKSSPDQLEATGNRLALGGHPGGAAMISIADRRRKLESEDSMYKTMRTSADQPGLFSDLFQSSIPQVAQSAKDMQKRLESSDPRAIPSTYWQNAKTALAARESSYLQAQSVKQTALENSDPLAKLNAARSAGTISPEEYTARKRVVMQGGDDATVDNTAKMIAEGRMAPLTGFAMRSPWGQQVMSRVSEINPDFSATKFQERQKVVNAFAAGKEGQTTRSFNVGIAHLDTLGDLAKALDNGDMQIVNKVANTYASQTGQPAPNNFNAAKDIVSNEIVKAIVGAGGGVGDRDKAQQTVSNANSPKQLAEVIETYKTLMGGQLSGLRRQYEVGTSNTDFDKFLSPEARRVAQKYAPKDTPDSAGAAATQQYPTATAANGRKVIFKDGKWQTP